MPRIAKKTARPRGKAKRNELIEGLPEDVALSETTVAEAAAPKSSEDLQPPTRPTEPGVTAEEAAPAADLAAAQTINISQLQAMSMAELNQMAKEMGIENFGTMKKHEVIFQILQKNAERSGILLQDLKDHFVLLHGAEVFDAHLLGHLVQFGHGHRLQLTDVDGLRRGQVRGGRGLFRGHARLGGPGRRLKVFG